MKKCDIIIPVFNSFDYLEKCLDSVLIHTDLQNNRLIIIDDKSDDERIIPFIEAFISSKKQSIIFIENEYKSGFVKTVNSGLKFSDNDILLMHPDVEVTEKWLEKIQKYAYEKEKIATVTPLSNNADIVSVPIFNKENEIPLGYNLDEFQSFIEDISYHDCVDIPMSQAFCLYIKREALNSVGFFDEKFNGNCQAEEDFCYRCLSKGFRHILCDDVIVFHKGNQSSLEYYRQSNEEDQESLKEKFPFYKSNTEKWMQWHPVNYINKNINYNLCVNNGKSNILILIHTWDISGSNKKIGGTSLHVLDVIQKLRDRHNFHVLAPFNGMYRLCSYWETGNESIEIFSTVSQYNIADYYNSDYSRMLNEIINLFVIDIVHIHHMLGHYFDLVNILKNGKVKVIISLHDYFPVCPRINKVDYNGIYCGFPNDEDCSICLSSHIDEFFTVGRIKDIASWKKLWDSLFSVTNKIIVPSESAKNEINQRYKEISIDVVEHGIDIYREIKELDIDKDEEYNVAFVGWLSINKGKKIVEDLIDYSCNFNHNIYFHLFGNMDYYTGEYEQIFKNEYKNFIYHGEYDRKELNNLFTENNIKLVCIFSIWPETFCYTLSESVVNNVPVLAIDEGAVGQRIKDYKLGWLINNGSGITEIYEKIKDIFNDKEEYKNIAKSVSNYKVKNVEEMCKEYDILYSSYKVNENRNSNIERMKFFIRENYEVSSKVGPILELNSQIILEKNKAEREKDEVTRERNIVSWERDVAKSERDIFVKELDEALKLKNELTAERYNLIAERNGLINSKSWRYTKPLREIGVFVRRNKPLYFFLKGIFSIKKNGIMGTVKKTTHYIYKKTLLLRKKSSSNNYNLSYDSDYQENIDFTQYSPEIKTVTFYLPQFHSIPENDMWWGEDFTEWTNTRKGIPRFDGHYQPREPHDDFGYYNLLDIETIKKQVNLAKQHGIYGFCFYYYWFSGKRLLEKPLNLFLEHKEIDINFCLCWANENWTRTWDGYDNEVLIQQEYTVEDPYKFIDDIRKYVDDKRYMKINGEPIIIVYNPSQILNIKDVFEIWRNWAKKTGIGKIKIWICRTFGHTAESLDIIESVDGEIEFPPHRLPLYNAIDIKGINGNVYDYKEIVEAINRQIYKERNNKSHLMLPIHRTVMLGWDNTARRLESGWTSYAGFSLKLFYSWVRSIIEEAKRKNNLDSSFVFINAWNEWGEGAYLEPDKRYGYANINTLSRAICGLPLGDNTGKKIIFVSHDAFNAGSQLLSLNIIRQLKETFGYDVYTVLKSGGSLIDEFVAVSSDIIVLDENKKDFEIWVKATSATTAICNTVISGDILHQLTEYGIGCISLIHEMEGVIRQYSCEANLCSIVEDALKIVYSSEFVRKSNEKITLIPEEKSIIHPQGLYMANPYLNNCEAMRVSIREKHNIPMDCKIVIAVGYGYYRKGIDLFVHCMLRVCKKINNTYFIWVGRIEEKALVEVNYIIKDSEYKNNFILTGWEPDPMRYYAAADIFLLTSREDPFPTVVMEAMNAYLPFIAFDKGGGYVEISGEETGGLVPMEDIETMANRTIELLENDDLRLKIGSYVHNYVEGKFNFIEYIYFLLALLQKKYKKVSVIIPNFNYSQYLSNRIENILTQTYPIFEIIILDDCSTDNSIKIIEEYVNKYPLRIRAMKNTKNSGNVFIQWEKGLEAAKGDYVWIAEADDLSASTFLEEILKRMSVDENIVMGYSQSKRMDENGNITENDYLAYTDKIDTIWRTDYTSDGKDEIEKRLSIKNTIVNVSAVVFKNEKLLKIIENAKKYTIAGDWRFYIDLLNAGGKITFIADSLNIHRRHSNSVTKTMDAKKHFNEVCEIQGYVYGITNNFEFFNNAREYREELKEYLGIKDNSTDNNQENSAD